MKGGNRFILRFAFRTVTERARPLETRSPCPTIANRHGSGEFAVKIQAHVIVTNSYRAGAPCYSSQPFCEGRSRVQICSDVVAAVSMARLRGSPPLLHVLRVGKITR